MPGWSEPGVIATIIVGVAGVAATIWTTKRKEKPAANAASEVKSSSLGNKCAVGIVQKGKDVILVRRKQAENTVLWQFPAGHVNPKRSPEETIAREVKEETGIDCKVVKEIGKRRHPDTKTDLVYFHCLYAAGELKNGDSEENEEVCWKPASQAHKLITSNLYEPVRTLLESIDAQ